MIIPICSMSSNCFEAPLLSRATAQTASEHMDTCHSTKETVRNSAPALGIMLYGVDTNWSRKKFGHGVRKEQVKFRFKIATNCLIAARISLQNICRANMLWGRA